MMMEPHKFIKDQYVYRQGEPIHSVFIVMKGEFALTRKVDRNVKRDPSDFRGKHLLISKNLPMKQNLAICGPGSLIADQDVVLYDNYSCSLQCQSMKGTLFYLKRESFLNL